MWEFLRNIRKVIMKTRAVGMLRFNLDCRMNVASMNSSSFSMKWKEGAWASRIAPCRI